MLISDALAIAKTNKYEKRPHSRFVTSMMFAEFVSPSGLGYLWWAVRGGIRVSNFHRCCWHWNGADRVGYFEGANDANDGDIWLAQQSTVSVEDRILIFMTHNLIQL